MKSSSPHSLPIFKQPKTNQMQYNFPVKYYKYLKTTSIKFKVISYNQDAHYITIQVDKTDDLLIDMVNLGISIAIDKIAVNAA
jgi:hypothetical protein